jgi:hypothetical protein
VTGSPLYAAACRRLADLPIINEVAPDDRWDLPLRLLGALHYIALAEGLDPWTSPEAVIADRRDWVAEFLATRRVQTNGVQRAWALLPAFLSLGESRLDLLELGPSAGLNLVWDRYRYRYLNGSWGPGDAALELAGEERAPVPAELLERSVDIVRRRGVDLEPVDATTDEGARLLKCFVWVDQVDRLARFDRALAALGSDPPALVQGDYVDLLPSLLRDRADGALTVVYQTASTQYLSAERYAELQHALAAAPRPLAWISTRRHEEEEAGLSGGYELEAALWPEHGPALVARTGYHGQWLEWRGLSSVAA